MTDPIVGLTGADVASTVMQAVEYIEFVSGEEVEESWITNVALGERPEDANEILITFDDGQVFRITVDEVESA